MISPSDASSPSMQPSTLPSQPPQPSSSAPYAAAAAAAPTQSPLPPPPPPYPPVDMIKAALGKPVAAVVPPPLPPSAAARTTPPPLPISTITQQQQQLQQHPPPLPPSSASTTNGDTLESSSISLPSNTFTPSDIVDSSSVPPNKPPRILPPPLPPQMQNRSHSVILQSSPIAPAAAGGTASRQPPPLPIPPRSASVIDTSTSQKETPPIFARSISLPTSPSPPLVASIINSPSPIAVISAPSTGSNSSMRHKIESEILSTEQSYLLNLEHFVSEFLAPLRARIRSSNKSDRIGSLDEEGLNKIAGNIETLTHFHATFYRELLQEFQKSSSNSAAGVALPSGAPNTNSVTPISTPSNKAVNSSSPDLAGVFLRFAEFFKMYTSFVSNYEACVVQMETLRENEKFQSFASDFQKKPRRNSVQVQLHTSNQNSVAPSIGHGTLIGIPVLLPTSPPPALASACVSPVPLLQQGTPQNQQLGPMDYMIQPVQRLPRYVLLLKELLKHSPEEANLPMEQSSIQQALSKIEAIATFVNERKRTIENMKKLLDMSMKIQKIPAEIHLIEPHRRLVKEGILTILASSSNKLISGMSNLLGSVKAKTCQVLLFNDMILWMNERSKFKGSMDLNQAPACIPSDQDPCLLQVSIATREFKQSIFLRGTTGDEVKDWKEAIESTLVALENEKETTRKRQTQAQFSLKQFKTISNSQGTPGTRMRIAADLFQAPMGGGDGDDDSRELSVSRSAQASDPQVQDEWLEREAREQTKREREKLRQALQNSLNLGAAGGGGPPGAVHVDSSGTQFVQPALPKDFIAQLKLQQLQRDMQRDALKEHPQSSTFGVLSSTCSTATNSGANSGANSLVSSRQASRRPSFSSNNNNYSKDGVMGTPTTNSHERTSSNSVNSQKSELGND